MSLAIVSSNWSKWNKIDKRQTKTKICQAFAVTISSWWFKAFPILRIIPNSVEKLCYYKFANLRRNKSCQFMLNFITQGNSNFLYALSVIYVLMMPVWGAGGYKKWSLKFKLCFNLHLILFSLFHISYASLYWSILSIIYTSCVLYWYWYKSDLASGTKYFYFIVLFSNCNSSMHGFPYFFFGTLP